MSEADTLPEADSTIILKIPSFFSLRRPAKIVRRDQENVGTIPVRAELTLENQKNERYKQRRVNQSI